MSTRRTESEENDARRILVAGGTGYLGRYVLAEARRRGWFVRALVRPGKSEQLKDLDVDEIVEAEVTRPESLKGICNGMDCVFSSVGITRQKDGLRYMDVDYGANRNLLDAAILAGVRRFVYVSVAISEAVRELRIIQAKERFVRELNHSSIDSAVIRPSGFFSDMKDILDMARGGRVYLFGDGSARVNPIHGADLAEVCLDACEPHKHVMGAALPVHEEIPVGGPQVLSQNEIAAAAFHALRLDQGSSAGRVTHLPAWSAAAMVAVLKRLPERLAGALEFILAAMTADLVVPAYGKRKLADFYGEQAQPFNC